MFAWTGPPTAGDHAAPETLVSVYDGRLINFGPGKDTLFLGATGSVLLAENLTSGHVDVWLAPQRSGAAGSTPAPSTTHLVGDWTC